MRRRWLLRSVMSRCGYGRGVRVSASANQRRMDSEVYTLEWRRYVHGPSLEAMGE